MTKVSVTALAGVMMLSACASVDQNAIAAEKFAQSTIDDPKIPIGPGSTLEVIADDFSFAIAGTAVDGPVTINFANVSPTADHNFRIDNAAGEVKKVEAPGGESATGELQLFGGAEYTYYCDVAGHRALGMEGNIRVLLPGESAEPTEPVATETTTDEPTATETPTEATPTVEDLDDSGDVAGALDDQGFARLYQVSFASGSSQLSDESASVITSLADYLEVNAGLSLRVEGNTDASGSSDSNLALSQDRADAVVAALVEAGIDGARLTAVGNGSSKPIVDEEVTDEDQRVNRRVEVFVV